MLDKTTEKIRRYREQIELLKSVRHPGLSGLKIDFKSEISKLETKICKLETIVSQN